MYIKTHDYMTDIAMRIVNAQRANHLVLDLPRSTFVLNLIEILYIEGYIKGYQVIRNAQMLHSSAAATHLGQMDLYTIRSSQMFNCYKMIESNASSNLLKESSIIPLKKFKNRIKTDMTRVGYNTSVHFTEIIRVYLKYKNGTPAINSISRCSKQSRRVYLTTTNIFLLKKKEPRSTYIISSSCGLIVDYKAIEQHTGGELLFKIL